MSTAGTVPLDSDAAEADDRARIPRLASTRRAVPASRLDSGDVAALGLCVAYGLLLLGFHRTLHDFSLRVYDFLHHAALARAIAEGRPAVDGFYPLGYPTLLALGFRLVPNLFVVGTVISGLAALLALFVTYRLLRALLRADEARWLPVAAIALVGASPVFLQHASTASTDMLHVALLLTSLWLVIEAVDSPVPARWVAIAGLVGGLSYLVRFTSTLVLPVLGLWLLLARPWGRDNLRLGCAYVLAFLSAASPQLILSTFQRGSPFFNTTLAKNAWVGNYAGALPELRWGKVADTISLAQVIGFDPGHFLLNWGANIVAAVLWGDVTTIVDWTERLVAGGTTLSGAGSLADVAVALLKLLALLGAGAAIFASSRWSPDIGPKVGFLGLFLLLFTATNGLAFITGRLLLITIPLLIVLALAALHFLVAPRAAAIVSFVVVAALTYHLAAYGYPERWMLGYGHAAETAARLRAAGASAEEVYSTNWGFYDYEAPWLDHYQPLPIELASVEALTVTMRARGLHYLVFDRNSGLAQWPQLAALLQPDTRPGGLQLVGPPILSREDPPNHVLIYALP